MSLQRGPGRRRYRLKRAAHVECTHKWQQRHGRLRAKEGVSEEHARDRRALGVALRDETRIVGAAGVTPEPAEAVAARHRARRGRGARVETRVRAAGAVTAVDANCEGECGARVDGQRARLRRRPDADEREVPEGPGHGRIGREQERHEEDRRGRGHDPPEHEEVHDERRGGAEGGHVAAFFAFGDGRPVSAAQCYR